MDSKWEHRQSQWRPQPDDKRTPFDVDYSRIVHSASFRRLQGKTQIFSLGDSDFYRTRLTHSIEVGQIATGITKQLQGQLPGHAALEFLPPDVLVQTLSFAHDLGHPPFGHGGEIALNYCMRNSGGFEGNGQTLRILAHLERFSAENGADLTRRSLLGILKYPCRYSKLMMADTATINNTTSRTFIDRKKFSPPKCYLDTEINVVRWILEPLADADRKYFEEFSTTDTGVKRSSFKSF